MHYRRLFAGEPGLLVSELGFGAAPIGFAGEEHQTDFGRLIWRAIELGINFFDTAAEYRWSEELLGEHLQGQRQNAIIATKCGRVQVRAGDGWQAYEDWSYAGVLKTVEQSLRRLRTDYLDLVQLHSPPPEVVASGEALACLQRAQEEGKLRFIGISADGDVARQALELGAFDTLQISYNVLLQEPERDILPVAAARGVGVIAKQPIANRIYLLEARPEHPDWARQWDLARRMNWKELAEGEENVSLALRWMLANESIATAIVGTTSIEHLEANVAAAELPALETDKRERIAEAYRRAIE